MHEVQARPLTAEDVAEGLQVLIKHGAGYVEGEIRNVARKPHNRHAKTQVIEEGERVDYGLFSITGFETSGTFWPDWEHEARMVNDVERPPNIPNRKPLRVLVPDPQGSVLAEVADVIGSSSRLMVHVPGLDPAAAEARLTEVLQAAGFEVWSAYTTADTEQRVDVMEIAYPESAGDKVIAANILESQGGVVGKSGYSVVYRPFDEQRTFSPSLSQS